MTTAVELDRYQLPMPHPATPVVLAHRVVSQGHGETRYASPVWPLAPLIDNPSRHRISIYWRICPDSFLEEMRLAAWTMINGSLRPTFLKERGARLRGRLSPEQIQSAVRQWAHLAAWLQKRQIHSLADCDSTVLHEYGLHLRDTGGNRDSVGKSLRYVTRLWAFDELSARPAGVARPPWDEIGIDDYLPAEKTTGAENSTEPLGTATMGPLLVWAMRVVDDLADDILAAWDEAARLRTAADGNRSNPQGKAALEALIEPLVAARAPIPATRSPKGLGLARAYLCGITGASGRQVDQLNTRLKLTAAAAASPGPCPLNIPVTGTIVGQPWRTKIDFNETTTLMRHLGTAAFIVCAYLTGMRPEEVLGLRSGCCPDPEPDDDGNLGRHLIRGHEYKGATDDDGNHLSAGVERDVPWVAITPVVNAIRVLERMVPPDTLLLDAQIHDFPRHRERTGSLRAGALRKRIEAFVDWANHEASLHQITHETIAPDPHGEIGTARFRRSLAWHIARRPGGLVALAIQYGHMRTALNTDVAAGYGSRSRGGIHDLMAVETALATAEVAADLRERFEAGEGISGPAARQALQAAATAPRFEGREVKPNFARKYLARDGAVLYDNPHALLLCLYKSDRALCTRVGTTDMPTLDRCVAGCGNALRTDKHAVQLRERASLLSQQAAHVPQPLGDRLHLKAERLRSDADAHDHNRITQPETTA